MSYILEALKKLEQKQREQSGTIPDLLSNADIATHEKRRPLWPYLVLTALMLNAGLLIWWMHPWSSKAPKASTRISEQQLHPDRSSMPSASGPIQTNADRNKKVEAKQTPADDRKRAPVISPPLPKQDRPIHLSSSEPHLIPAAAEGSSEQKVFNLTDLPPSVQQGLPEIKISLHYYTVEPSSRMVRINDKTVQEGQDLAAGLKLEEITPTGIVLSYQAYRFRMRAF